MSTLAVSVVHTLAAVSSLGGNDTSLDPVSRYDGSAEDHR